MTALEWAEKLARPHTDCEDGWYSCPRSANGCLDITRGTKCNCGRDEEVTRISQALQEASDES